MNVKQIRILSEAADDLDEGRVFYEEQGIHQKDFGFYRMLAKRFPYAIYYDFIEGIVSVVAVLPIRRDPVWIETKMSGRN